MYLNAAGWTEGSALVGDIDFTKFTANAKIELHGCRTAEGDSASDNMPPIFPFGCGRQVKAPSRIDLGEPEFDGAGWAVRHEGRH
jgi:hypothetical protein